MVRRPNRRPLEKSGRLRAKVKRHPCWASKESIALMSFRLFRLTPLGSLLLLLLGCSSKIVVCPVPAILADTQTVTIFRPGTPPDLANELYTVSLVDSTNDCTYSTKDGLVHASLELTFRATRVPTREAATYSLPYFIAINEGPKIYVKHLYNLKFTFAPGAAVATIKQSPDEVEIKIGNGKLPWNYQQLAGFQMTSAQIEYNKTKSRYLP
jgi:hypothetical protein